MTTYAVAQRRQEIGVRIALGAQVSDITGLFVSHGAKLAAIGIVIGVAAALVGSRVLSSLLFGIEPTDAASYVLAIIPMLLTAIVASHLPARRAARIDPMITLQDRAS
jgi:putative ABC transport system permease protein